MSIGSLIVVLALIGLVESCKIPYREKTSEECDRLRIKRSVQMSHRKECEERAQRRRDNGQVVIFPCSALVVSLPSECDTVQ